jgi:hypothetical protein
MKATFLNKILLFLFCISFSFQKIYSFDLPEAEFDLGYTVGKYINIGEHAEIGAFIPFELCSPYQFFIDGRGYRFNGGKWATSAGVGIRSIFFDCDVLGVNAYYDYRRGKAQGDFQQVGIGGEWLTNWLEFRINGYIPVGSKMHKGHFHSFDLGDGYLATRQQHQFAFGGFDAEIGLPYINYYGLGFYGGIGPYFYGKEHHDHFWGGFARFEMDWRSILYAEVVYSYDKIHTSNVQGVFRFSIPLNFFCDSYNCDPYDSCGDLLTNRVHRSGIILLDNSCHWTWNWNDK